MASAILPIALSAAGALGGLFGNRNRNTGTTTPTFDPRFAGLRDILLRNTMRNMNQGSQLPAAYRSAGISNINSTAAGGAANLDANLTSRGLGTSPAAAPALAINDGRRQGAINEFENVTIPDEEHRRQQESINRAIELLGMGRGVTSTSQQNEGGGIGGGLEGLGEILGFLMGQGRIGGGRPGTVPGSLPPPTTGAGGLF